MGYSASAVAIIGVKLPREKVFNQIEVPHRCEFMPEIMPAVAFRFCPYCGKSAKATTEEVCVFSDDVDWIAIGKWEVDGLDFYQYEKPNGKKDYYFGVRVYGYHILDESVLNVIHKIDESLAKYGITEKYQFGIHVILEESY